MEGYSGIVGPLCEPSFPAMHSNCRDHAAAYLLRLLRDAMEAYNSLAVFDSCSRTILDSLARLGFCAERILSFPERRAALSNGLVQDDRSDSSSGSESDSDEGLKGVCALPNEYRRWFAEGGGMEAGIGRWDDLSVAAYAYALVSRGIGAPVPGGAILVPLILSEARVLQLLLFCATVLCKTYLPQPVDAASGAPPPEDAGPDCTLAECGLVVVRRATESVRELISVADETWLFDACQVLLAFMVTCHEQRARQNGYVPPWLRNAARTRAYAPRASCVGTSP